MSSALSLEKTMTIAYLGPEATFTHQAAIQKFGSSLLYSAQKTIAGHFHRSRQKPRRLRRGAGGEFHRRGGDTHPGHVRGQQPANCRADCFAHPILPGGRGQFEGCAAPLRPSPGPGPVPRLGAAPFAQGGNFRNLLQRPFRRTGRQRAPAANVPSCAAKSPPSPVFWRRKNTI